MTASDPGWQFTIGGAVAWTIARKGPLELFVTLFLKTGAHLSTGEECPRRLKEIPNVRLGGSSRGGKNSASFRRTGKSDLCFVY